MAATRETPRQKMIAVMYLVLLALLALNVSKDVINAFVVVDENIMQSNRNFSQKLQDIYADFERNYLINQEKVKPYWIKANEAKSLSLEMVKYINNLRNELISKTEGISVDSAKNTSVKNLTKKDNYTIPTNYFLRNLDKNSNCVANKLKNKIIEYRQNMLNLVDIENIDIENVSLGLTTSGPYYNADNKEQNWETHFFYNTILAADIPILNKIILDVYNAEFDVVNLLFKSVGHGEFKFDIIEAKVLPKSNLVFVGDNYQAEIIVAASDTTQSPEVYYSKGIDFLPIEQTEQALKLENKPGKKVINLPARIPGIKKYAGFVRAKTSTGNINNYHFNGEYIVAKPSYSISAKKMNVFYTGVDNPVSISVSGIPAKKLTLSISCGTIKADPFSNDWIVNILPGFTKAIIDITANINGIQKRMGSKVFRVKKLPDPIAKIANKNSGVISKEILISAATLTPKMPDDFEFDHSFEIVSFTLTIQRGFRVYNYYAENSYLTDEMIKQINQTNKGQNIVFEDIIASDPFGIDRLLSPIILTLN